MLLRNHGTLAVGRNVGECFRETLFLERACQAQIMALTAGDQLNTPPQGAAEVTAQQGAAGLAVAANMLAWPALRRKATGSILASPVGPRVDLARIMESVAAAQAPGIESTSIHSARAMATTSPAWSWITVAE